MERTYSEFDAAEHLRDEADIAAYLEAVFEDHGDDAAFVAKALGTVARARGISKLAKDSGITRAGIYKATSGNGNPSFVTMAKLLDGLGLRLTVAPKTSAAKIVRGKKKGKSDDDAVHA